MARGNKRRKFLKQTSASIASIPLFATSSFWELSEVQTKSGFLLDANITYLNTGSLGPSPSWVPDQILKITKLLESNPVAQNWGPLGKEMEEVRVKVASFINCTSEEVVLTRNATEGLSLISSNLDLKAGDEILTTTHEHGGGEIGLKFAEATKGVTIRNLQLPYPAESKDQIIQTIQDAISDNTRLLMLSHVSTITGMVMPLKEITETLEGKDIFVLADGAQACGMIDVDVTNLGVDAYATSGHKWLLGPKETGFLYVKKSRQQDIKAVFTHSGYGSYSASSGTRNVAQHIVLGEVLEWHNRIGKDDTFELSNYCYNRLQKLDSLDIISPKPAEMRGFITSVNLKSTENRTVFESLKSKGVIVKLLPKYNALRFSTHIFNTKEEVDLLISELSKV